jgi:hypothetical protein
MTQTVLHFVFTPSGAGCLSQALRTAGRDDQVISFFDDLSFGPINPPIRRCGRNGLRMNLAGPDGTTLPPSQNGSGAGRLPPIIERSHG